MFFTVEIIISFVSLNLQNVNEQNRSLSYACEVNYLVPHVSR